MSFRDRERLDAAYARFAKSMDGHGAVLAGICNSVFTCWNMKFFPAEVRVNGTAVADVNGRGLGRLQLPVEMFGQVNGSSIQLAIRPEKLRMSDRRPEGQAQFMQGRLSSASYLGDRSHYYVEIEVAVSAQNAQRADQRSTRIGETVWLSWTDDAVIVLQD